MKINSNTNKITLFLLSFFFVISSLISEEKRSIAVLDFDATGVSQNDVKTLSNRVNTMLSQSENFTVIERSKINQLLSEQSFQLTGVTSNESMVEMGEVLGVELMFAGGVGHIGKTYTIDIRVIEVETGEVIHSASTNVRGEIDDLLFKGLPEVLNKLISNDTTSTQTVVQVQTTPIASTLPANQPSIDVCRKAKFDAKQSIKGYGWIGAGFFCNVFGYGASYIIDPKGPPAKFLIGKDEQYVISYTTCYKEEAKSIQKSKALTGCLAYGAYYIIGLLTQ